MWNEVNHFVINTTSIVT